MALSQPDGLLRTLGRVISARRSGGADAPIGTLAVVGLFLVLAWRGVDIAKRAADPFGSLLATGLTVLIFAYAALNMAMVVGIFPVMGVPLPFVSYGGSALVTNLAAVGILLSVDRRGRAHERWLRRWRRT